MDGWEWAAEDCQFASSAMFEINAPLQSPGTSASGPGIP
jgi:hypothetical protein